MNDKSNKTDEPEDLTDDVEEVSEEDNSVNEEDVKPVNNYRIEIQNGNVFAGTLALFEEQFFLFPPGVSDEEKLKHIEMWAYDQGWAFQANLLH